MGQRAAKFARSMAADLPANEAEGVVEWITILLPLILSLPCFQPKTAAEKYQWITEKPRRAVNHLIPQMRAQQTERVRRVAVRAKAEQAVTEICGMSRAAFVKLHDEVVA